MLGTGSSYGAATPIPNPVDGLRVIGLLSRIGPAALACSYAGIGLIVLSWVLIGRLAAPGRVRRLSRSQLSHTLAMWAVPLLVTPPLFSRDVYSYLAIGSMMVHDFNPYAAGPYDTLGDSDPYAHQVDVRWQHTASPYGPVYLLIAKAVVSVAGQNVVLGTLLQRLVEVVGVALIVWALPRLARICGFDPVAALWLGALNPLVLFHLIGGGHNEALMLGAMLAGMVIAWEWSLVGGVVLITLGVGVKATAGMALAFLVIMLALRAGGRWRDLLRCAAQVGAVAIVTFGVFTALAGVGFGWLAALGAPGTVRSFLSVSTDARGRRRRGRVAAGPGRSHPGGAGRHAAGRHADRFGDRGGDHVAVLAAADQSGARTWHGDGRVRAAGPGDPALVPAVGGAAAGRVDGRSAVPQGDDLADGAVLGDDHAERRDHPGLRDRAGGGGRGRRGGVGAVPAAPLRAAGHLANRPTR